MTNKKPLILGSSFTGLVLSLQLSRSGVDHYLVGGPEPDDRPRLGESLNECAGPELWRLFGMECDDCFYPKSHISLFAGDFVSQVHIDNPNRTIQSLKKFAGTLQTPGTPALGRPLLHVDRIKFDKHLYHAAQSKSHCEFLNDLAEQIDFRASDDSVTAIHLRSGKTIFPQYVFDATGYRGVVAEAAGIQQTFSGDQKRVAWTHFTSDNPERCSKTWWYHGTNLLRLDERRDGIEGIAWLIPLGNTLSVGISVDSRTAPQDAFSSRELTRKIVDGLANRGLVFDDEFREQEPVNEITHRYFVRDRAYGENWLLAGGTFIQIWFPSSAGIWTTTAAAGMAKQFVEEPMKTGRQYEIMMEPLKEFHDHLDKMISGPVFENRSQVFRFWGHWLGGLPGRLADYRHIMRGAKDRVSLSDRILASMTPLLQGIPKLQLLVWGLVRTCVKRPPTMEEQASSFPWYFRRVRFRAANYLRGFSELLKFRRGNYPSASGQGGTRCTSVDSTSDSGNSSAIT